MDVLDIPLKGAWGFSHPAAGAPASPRDRCPERIVPLGGARHLGWGWSSHKQTTEEVCPLGPPKYWCQCRIF